VDIHNAYKRLAASKFLPIVRGKYTASEYLGIAEALSFGGASLLEVTLNSPGALAAIEQIRTRHLHLCVGAGTVLTLEDAVNAVDSGAQFLVSPHVSLQLLEFALARGLLILPGALTPTEILLARNSGQNVVKLFPAHIFGSRYITTLHGPLPDVEFVPTGGITFEQIGAFLDSGALAVGLGSTLIPARFDPDALMESTKEIVRLVQQRST